MIRRSLVRQRRGRIASGIGTALLVASLGVLLASALAGHASYRLLTVWTGSMGASAPVGSLLIERLQPATDVRPGQIVTFREPDRSRVITHRVVTVDHRVGETFLVTKGDANPVADRREIQLLGDDVWYVVAVVPHVGRAFELLRTPPARVLTGRVAPVLLVITAMILIWRPTLRRRQAPHPRSGAFAVMTAAGLLALSGTVLLPAGAARADFSTSVSRGHGLWSALLLAPTGIAASSRCIVTSATVDLSWTLPSDDRTGVRVERRVGASPTWVSVANLAANAVTFSDTSTTILETYTYRLRDTRSTWVSSPSTTVSATTGVC